MKYLSKTTLDTWVQSRQKQIIRVNIFAGVLYFFMGLGVYFNTNEQFSGNFFFGVSILFLVFLFVLLGSRFNSRIVNNTIKEIEITGTSCVIKTFQFRFIYVYTFEEKLISKDFHDIKLSLVEYPLVDGKKTLKRECYKLKVDEGEFYLLKEYFEDELSSIIKNKFHKNN